MSDKTGGPAFPRPASTDQEFNARIPPQQGMTLRDYFAAKAMQAIITGCVSGNSRADISWTEADLWAPTIAYQVADAMLAARQE